MAAGKIAGRYDYAGLLPGRVAQQRSSPASRAFYRRRVVIGKYLVDLDDAGRRELPILGRSVNFDLLSGPIENYFGCGGRKADGGVLVGGAIHDARVGRMRRPKGAAQSGRSAWLICVAQRDAARVRAQGAAINCGAGTYA